MKLYHKRIDIELLSFDAYASDTALYMLRFAGERSSEDFEYIEIIDEENAILNQVEQELNDYMKNPMFDFQVPLHYECTAFEEEIYDILRTIKKPISYGELAKMTSRPKAHRAVASAMRKNDFVIIVPCHRVILSNGKLGNYNGGIDKKIMLLEHEGYWDHKNGIQM